MPSARSLQKKVWPCHYRHHILFLWLRFMYSLKCAHNDQCGPGLFVTTVKNSF